MFAFDYIYCCHCYMTCECVCVCLCSLQAGHFVHATPSWIFMLAQRYLNYMYVYESPANRGCKRQLNFTLNSEGIWNRSKIFGKWE